MQRSHSTVSLLERDASNHMLSDISNDSSSANLWQSHHDSLRLDIVTNGVTNSRTIDEFQGSK